MPRLLCEAYSRWQDACSGSPSKKDSEDGYGGEPESPETVDVDMDPETVDVGKQLDPETADVGKQLDPETADVGKQLESDTADVGKQLESDTVDVGKQLESETVDVVMQLGSETADVGRGTTSPSPHSIEICALNGRFRSRQFRPKKVGR